MESKEQLYSRIFKEIYQYKELEISEGLIFYEIKDKIIYINEMIARKDSKNFLFKAYFALRKIARKEKITTFRFCINIENNRRLVDIYENMGAELYGLKGNLRFYELKKKGDKDGWWRK